MVNIQQLLPEIPTNAPITAGWIAAGVAVVGGGLWLVGSRFGRSLMALAGVAAGAALGLQIPRWCNIDIRSWATAVGGALVLGVLGYLLHRLISRVGLVLLLVAWAGLACWMLFGPDKWSAPDLSDNVRQFQPAAVQGYAQELWKSIPDDLRRYGPIAIGGALVAGVVIALFLGRLATSLFYSIVGATVAVGAGLTAVSFLKPDLLERVPADARLQLEFLAGAVALGALIQWVLAPRARRPAPPPPPVEEFVVEPKHPAAPTPPPPPPPPLSLS